MWRMGAVPLVGIKPTRPGGLRARSPVSRFQIGRVYQFRHRGLRGRREITSPAPTHVTRLASRVWTPTAVR